MYMYTPSTVKQLVATCTCTCSTISCVFLLHRVKQELLPLVRTLSQDVDHEVRISMCKELPGIAGSLG